MTAAPTSDQPALPPVGLWTGSLDYVPLSQACEYAVEIEELGYGALWLPEVAGRDVFVHLAMMLATTRTLVGATGIANIWARDAVTMAGSAATLTEAFPGRFLLGLGVSHRDLVEDVRGSTYTKPLHAMSTYLDAMTTAPYTAQRPTTPVRRLLGALGPKMVELARDKTSGTHPYLVTPEYTKTAREALGPDQLLCPQQRVLLCETPSEARDTCRRLLAPFLRQENYRRNFLRMGFTEDDVASPGTDRLIDHLVAWGAPEKIRSRIQAHLDAGANHVAVHVLNNIRRSVPAADWRILAHALT